MKTSKGKCDFIQSRNENLRREFMARIGRSGRFVIDVFRELQHCQADRFYISEERALLLIKERIKLGISLLPPGHCRSAVKGKTPAGVRALRKVLQVDSRRRMIEDIERRVAFMLAADPALPLGEAVFRVVNSPAPSFYLTLDSMRIILYAYLRNSKTRA